MNVRYLIGAGITLALVALAAGGAAVALRATQSPPAEFQGGVLTPPVMAPDFTLPSAKGGDVRLSDYRGKVVLLFFGYTNCPDVCPTTMLEVANVRKQLTKEEAARVQVVFVSVDPERDVAARLSQYVERFDPTIVALRPADDAKAHEVVQLYQADFAKGEPNAGGGYAVAHPASVYVIDPAGQWRLLLPFGMPVEALTDDVRLLLKETTHEN